MRIVAVPCKASDLQPGDLFSSVGPEFWDQAHLGVSADPRTGQVRPGAIGVKVYIRTEVPFDPIVQDGADEPMWKLHIIPTVVEQLIGEEALASIIEQDTNDPIEGQLKLEVVRDDDDDLESE